MSWLREMPQVDVQDSPERRHYRWHSEVGVPPLAPAYFRLTGKRVRSLPMFPTGGG